VVVDVIVEWLLTVLAAVVSFFGGLMPSFPAPAWMTTTLPSWIATASERIYSVDVWFPFSHAVAVLALIVTALLVASAIRVLRITASFATFGGGSAA
jgi:hypothetical protein